MDPNSANPRIRLRLPVFSFTPGDHFDNCRRSRSHRCGGGMEDETGKKKAVSVSLGPGCRFVGGTSRLRPRPDRSGLSLDESMTSMTVRPSGCQRRNRASNKIHRLGSVPCRWGPPPHGAGQWTDWSSSFLHCSAWMQRSRSSRGGTIQDLRRLQWSARPWSFFHCPVHSLRQSAFDALWEKGLASAWDTSNISGHCSIVDKALS